MHKIKSLLRERASLFEKNPLKAVCFQFVGFFGKVLCRLGAVSWSIRFSLEVSALQASLSNFLLFLVGRHFKE